MIDIGGEIVSSVRVTVHPENCRELSLTISSLLGRIRREQGCLTYRFYSETGDDNSFILVGEWETRADWDHHLKSDNFAVLLGSLKLMSNLSKVDFKVLSHISGVEALTRARCTPQKAISPIPMTLNESRSPHAGKL